MALATGGFVQQAAKSQQNQRYSCFSKVLPLMRLAASYWVQA
jgi:hypothetical protein